jgi:phospholipid/cholesterol/gamma-HCH transport system ATP-binding protein
MATFFSGRQGCHPLRQAGCLTLHDMSETIQDPVIEMRDVTVGAMRDTSLSVLENVNWSVAAGEFWVVAGQEHAGKSDLIMLAAGLMLPVAGSCRLFGTETRDFGEAELAERLRVGFVFQGGQLFTQLTIAENVALPLRYQKNLPVTEIAGAVENLLELLELTPFANLTPGNVPANWRQRAALARALILKPEVLLLDNPQAGLASRHLQWWLRFLDQLGRGHEYFGGAPMTIVATADDLRPWKNAQRKFALLRDKQFIPLGAWNEVEIAADPVVKELLTATTGITS